MRDEHQVALDARDALKALCGQRTWFCGVYVGYDSKQQGRYTLCLMVTHKAEVTPDTPAQFEGFRVHLTEVGNGVQSLQARRNT